MASPYRDRVAIDSGVKKGSSVDKQKRWFSLPMTEEDERGTIHQAIWKETQDIEVASSQRWEMWRRYDQVYGDPYWFQPSSSLRTIPEMEVDASKKLKINKTRSFIETYASRLGSTRILPVAMPKGGSPDIADKCKLHNRLVEGAYENEDVYDYDSKWNRDMARYGTAWGYFDEDGDDPVILRVDPYTAYVNDSEWEEGIGRTFHWLRPRPRDLLIAEFPEYEAEIKKAATAQFNHATRYLQPDVENDMVPCFYSWARPMGKAKGRRCITIRNATLLDMPWKDDLPFAFMTRTPPTRGPWGEPLMADLAPLQEALDRYHLRIDESLWLMNVLRLILRKNCGFNKSKVNNIPGTIYETLDPEHDVVSKNWEISPQLMEFVQYALGQMQELSRSSKLQTTGETEKHVRSYKAARLEVTVDDQGLREPLRSRDRFYKRSAELLMQAFERIGPYKALVKVGKTLKQVSYKDIKLPRGSYMWTVAPSDFKDKTVEGRMDQGDWLVERGILPESELARFVDYTDMENMTDMAMAQNDAIMMRINKIRVDGEYIPPHPMMNLALLRKLAGDAYCRGEADGLDEDKLELLKNLVVEGENIEIQMEAQKAAKLAAAQKAVATPAGGSSAAPPPSPAGAGPTMPMSPTEGSPIAPGLGALQGPVPPLTQQPQPAAPSPPLGG